MMKSLTLSLAGIFYRHIYVARPTITLIRYWQKTALSKHHHHHRYEEEKEEK